MINTNDLIGLRYGWRNRPGDGSGKTDCFQLACEVHRRFGFADYSPEFDWVYEQFTDDTFKRRSIARWLLQNGTRCTEPKPGMVILLPGQLGAALGTYTDETRVLFIGPNHNVVKGPMQPSMGKLFWMAR